jgi:2-octaprenyl-6-methoxyphenol hydroxylase
MSHDVAIVGGGMVGASFALSLAPLKVRVALIEAVPFDDAAQPSFDERTTALSNGSRRILETLGVWAEVQAAATPIGRIHVSDQGRFGFARIDAKEQGLQALGYVLANRTLGAALWRRLGAAKNITLLCPGSVGAVQSGRDEVALNVRRGDASESLRCRLAVAADGADSALRTAMGITAERRDYQQTALISTVLPQRFHDHVAYERFTPEGPLALLPLADGRCTVVLTLNRAASEAALACSDAQFLDELQRRFGFRLGRFLKVGRRVAYPLHLTRAQTLSAGRVVMVGNAAQSLHPVAGMGFNLGLRDVASLAELIAERCNEAPFDCGAAELLSQYGAWRAADRRGVIGFTDGLVRAFANPLRSVGMLRDLGLLAFDLLPPAKGELSRLSTGDRGRVPKLARGVPLT